MFWIAEWTRYIMILAVLDAEYEKHGYPMLEILLDVIIDTKTEDWCVEGALPFYTSLAQREHAKEIGDILYEILIKHKKRFYATPLPDHYYTLNALGIWNARLK